MKVKTLIMTFALFAVMTGCSKTETSTVVPVNNKVTLKAYVNNPATKVGFADDGAFYWSKDDKLGVLVGGETPSFKEFTLKEEDKGKASGTFTGTIPEGAGFGSYAVYPYNANHSVSGNMLTYDFPANYNYEKVDGDYFTETPGDGNSFNAPMWGAIDADGSVQMKHLGGVFCIKIDKMPCETGTLTLTSDKKISGAYTVDLSATEEPQIAAAEATTDEEKTVSIAFSGATKDSPGVFYVPAPVGKHNVTITMADTISFKGVYVINRKSLQKVEPYTSNVDITTNVDAKKKSWVYTITTTIGECKALKIKENTYTTPTLPKTGNLTLSMYAMAWNGKKTTFTITINNGGTIDGNEAKTESLEISEPKTASTSESGTFNLNIDYFYTWQLSDITPESTITFKAAKPNDGRVIIAAVNVN